MEGKTDRILFVNVARERRKRGRECMRVREGQLLASLLNDERGRHKAGF